jgi:hypothetical protein
VVVLPPRVRWSNGMSRIIIHAYSYPRACSVLCIAYFSFPFFFFLLNFVLHIEKLN